MSRRGRITKRKILPDAVYGSILVHKFINKMMAKGKKSVAEKIFYTAMKIVEEKTKKPALSVFEQALKNAAPLMEVKARRVGGATYQIPIEVESKRGMALAMQWIRGYARARAGKSMEEKLAAEILDAYNQTGASIKKREDAHKAAEANKAFAHFRW